MYETPHASDHLVQFYDTDQELIDAVVPYLAEGLRAGENVVVIATGAHREAFAAALAKAGIDVAPDGAGTVTRGGLGEGRTGGEYTALDAAYALERLRGGEGAEAEARSKNALSERAFDGFVGELVRERLATGRPLRAYGEIVALLWNEGDPAGAIELEAMWNRLGQRCDFSLFCGYPSPPSAVQHAALPDVCAAHTCIVPAVSNEDEQEPAPVLDAELPADVRSPSLVRTMLRSALEELHLDEDLVDRGILTASELASNAVLHARTAFRLRVQPRDSSIWIGVEDRAPLRSRLQVVGRSRHGLAIIAALATRWGVKPSDSGKLVWAELPL